MNCLTKEVQSLHYYTPFKQAAKLFPTQHFKSQIQILISSSLWQSKNQAFNVKFQYEKGETIAC